MKYKIYTTEEFNRIFNKLDGELQNQIGREIEQLEENPYLGRPLGYSFFREKKVKNYRIYYLIYKDYLVIFVITLSTKKTQQKTIDTIKHLIPMYREEIKKKLSL